MNNNFVSKFILTLILGLIISGFIFIGILQQPTKKLASSTTLSIYQKPNKQSELITQASQNDPIIGIYQKGAWIEVANTMTGKVGWMTYPEFNTINNSRKNIFLMHSQTNQRIKLDKFSQQALELQQQLNTELRTQPDPKAIKKMEASYESQLLLIQKMIKNMQADLKHYQ